MIADFDLTGEQIVAVLKRGGLSRSWGGGVGGVESRPSFRGSGRRLGGSTTQEEVKIRVYVCMYGHEQLSSEWNETWKAVR